MKQKSIFLLFILTIFLAASCKQEFIGADDGDYALIISYDKQETSYQNNSNVQDTSKLTTSDLLSSLPIVTREQWKIQIKEDGTCRMEVNILEPTENYGRKKSEMYNPETEIKRKVFENNKGYYFNENNKLINTFDFELPNYKDLIELYKNQNKDKYTLKDSKLKDERIIGQNIVITENRINDEAMGNLIEKLYIDTAANVLVKTELFDDKNSLISNDTIEYGEFAPGHLMPTYEKHTSFITNINKQDYTSESTTQYLSIDIINNL